MSSRVQIQTLRGNDGHDAAVKSVEDKVAEFNKANPKSDHKAVVFQAVAPNVKGMQFSLALLATVARQNGAAMIRLSVHGGEVALCGPAKAIEATRVATGTAYIEYQSLASATHNPKTDGNKIGWTNAFLCGCPAGLQDAHKLQATLVYGIGFLFPFPAPGSGAAYEQGYTAALKSAKPAAPPKVKAPKVPKTPQAPKMLVEIEQVGDAPAVADVS